MDGRGVPNISSPVRTPEEEQGETTHGRSCIRTLPWVGLAGAGNQGAWAGRGEGWRARALGVSTLHPAVISTNHGCVGGPARAASGRNREAPHPPLLQHPSRGCAAPPQSHDAAPQVTRAKAESILPVLAPQEFLSGGLGADGATWERRKFKASGGRRSLLRKDPSGNWQQPNDSRFSWC